jgi:hypothetical protein
MKDFIMIEYKVTQKGGGEVIVTLPSTPIVPMGTYNTTNPSRWGGSEESIVAVAPNGEFRTRGEIQVAMDSYRGMDFDDLLNKGFRLITSFAPTDAAPIEELEVRRDQPWGGEYLVAHFTPHAESKVYTPILDEEDVFELDKDGNVEVAVPHSEDKDGNYLGYVVFNNATYKVNIIVH